jgi:hypothetical protein
MKCEEAFRHGIPVIIRQVATEYLELNTLCQHRLFGGLKEERRRLQRVRDFCSTLHRPICLPLNRRFCLSRSAQLGPTQCPLVFLWLACRQVALSRSNLDESIARSRFDKRKPFQFRLMMTVLFVLVKDDD